MRVDLHAMRMREGDDVAAGGEAAGDAEVGLRDVDRARGEEVAEAEGRVLVLAAGDRRRESTAYLGVALEVLLRDRLLVPAQPPAHFLEAAAQANRIRDAVGMVHVDHHLVLCAELAYCAHDR